MLMMTLRAAPRALRTHVPRMQVAHRRSERDCVAGARQVRTAARTALTLLTTLRVLVIPRAAPIIECSSYPTAHCEKQVLFGG